jgi:hypothetical protein
MIELTLNDFGLTEPTTLAEAKNVISNLLDRCNQLEEIIIEMET